MFRHLRQGGKRRRKRTYGPEKRGKLANKPMIDSRPEAIELRQEVGHWEGDTVMGAAGERNCLLTLVERTTGLAKVVRLQHRTVLAVNRATIGLLWGIFSGVIYAVIAACNRVGAAKRQASSLQACWWQFFAISVVTVFAAPQLSGLNGMGWVWLFGLGVLCTGLAYWLFIDSLSAINARTAAMIFALEPVYAIAIAWVFLHDVPSLRMLLGGSLIIAAVVAAARFKSS